MRRHNGFILAAIGCVALAQPALADKFTLGHQFAPDSLPGQSAQHFADLVAEKTGGETTVTVIPGGGLGDERANLQQLSNGSLDMSLTGTIVLDFMAQPYVLASMPFVYDSPAHTLAVFQGEIGQELKDYLVDNHEILNLGWQFVGTRELTANRKIESIEDLSGVRLRLPSGEISAKTWQAMGANIASVAFTELYLALQTGTVDAQENPPNFIRAQKFYEVQDYLITTGHRPQLNGFFMNAPLHEGLDEATRTAIDEAAAETVAWTSQRASEIEREDVAWLTSEGGMELVEFDPAGVQEAIKSIPQDLLGEDGAALYERIRDTKY